MDARRRVRRHLQAQIKALVDELGPHQFQDLRGHVPRLQPAQVEIELAGLDAREVEDVVDQGAQVAARGMDDPRLALLMGGEGGLVLGQHLRQQQDGVQRGAQFVADVGQELGLVAIGTFQFLGMGAGAAQVLGVIVGQGGEFGAEGPHLQGALPTEADLLAGAHHPVHARRQFPAHPFQPAGEPAGGDHHRQDQHQDDAGDAQDQGVAKAVQRRGVHRPPHPEGAAVLGDEHGHPEDLGTPLATPEPGHLLGEELLQPGKVGEGQGLVPPGLTGAEVASPVGDPEGVAVELGHATDVDIHHHQPVGRRLGGPGDGAHQAEAHELARVPVAGIGVDADAADQDLTGGQAQTGAEQFLGGAVR